MSRPHLIATVLCFTLLAQEALAEVRRHVDYYLAGGSTFPVFGGDLDGSGFMGFSDSIGSETTWIPDVEKRPLASGAIGALVDGNDISLSLAYGAISAKTNNGRSDASLLEVSFVYAYQFFWPEAFRPRVSLGWSYLRLNTEHSSYHVPRNGDASTWSGAILSGSAPGIGAGLGWYPVRSFGLTLDTRARYYWIRTLSTDQFDLAELNKSIQSPSWQTELQARFIF